MRTTLDLDDDLVKAVKRAAAESGTTMTAIIERSLRQMLLEPAPPAKPFRLKLPTFKGRLAPGADIADRDALYDLMEGRD